MKFGFFFVYYPTFILSTPFLPLISPSFTPHFALPLFSHHSSLSSPSFCPISPSFPPHFPLGNPLFFLHFPYISLSSPLIYNSFSFPVHLPSLFLPLPVQNLMNLPQSYLILTLIFLSATGYFFPPFNFNSPSIF